MNKTCVFFLALFSATSLTASESQVITFYNVPLVCGAAPDIGCGSRAKPALLEMEQSAAIEEAWLNHQGTMYAIVWKEKDQTKKVAKPIFEKHFIGFDRAGKQETEQLMIAFREKGKWLRAGQVDELSLIEAGRLAEDAVWFLVEDNTINAEEAELIRQDVEIYFRTELVKVRTLEELDLACATTFQDAVIEVYRRQLGAARTAAIITKYEHQRKIAEEKFTDCCKKNGTVCKH